MIGDDASENEGKVLDIEAREPTRAQQVEMLAIARRAIAAYLEKKPLQAVQTDDAFLDLRAGLFVTLREKPRRGRIGQLRGCIGHMQADQSLAKILPEMAIQAATADPRFLPMKRQELDHVTIDIAILSAMFPIAGPEEIVIGKHGLVLSGEGRRALLLPKSPILYGWDVDSYLANLHQKAGLPADYWPRRGELYAFTSFDFGE